MHRQLDQGRQPRGGHVDADRVQGPVVVGRHQQRVELRALAGENSNRERLANVSFDDEVTAVADRR